MSKKSRVRRIPAELDTEIESVRSSLNLFSKGEAMRKVADFSRIGRETLIKKKETKLRLFK